MFLQIKDSMNVNVAGYLRCASTDNKAISRNIISVNSNTDVGSQIYNDLATRTDTKG